MPTENLVRLTYWGGWASAVVALFYKLLLHLGVMNSLAFRTMVFPRHFWEMSFLLFLVCIATATLGRAKSA